VLDSAGVFIPNFMGIRLIIQKLFSGGTGIRR
jgi:hypothetical protein